MASFMLSINLLILVIKTVLSMNCPFCADFKDECGKKDNVHSMDCDTFKIKDKPAKDEWKNPKQLTPLLDMIEGVKENKVKKHTINCGTVEYHLKTHSISSRQVNNDLNATTTRTIVNEIIPQLNYTLKSCLIGLDDEDACKLIKDYAKFDGEIVIDDCSVTNSARLSSLPDRLIVLTMSVVLLKMFV